MSSGWPFVVLAVLFIIAGPVYFWVLWRCITTTRSSQRRNTDIELEEQTAGQDPVHSSGAQQTHNLSLGGDNEGTQNHNEGADIGPAPEHTGDDAQRAGTESRTSVEQEGPSRPARPLTPLDPSRACIAEPQNVLSSHHRTTNDSYVSGSREQNDSDL